MIIETLQGFRDIFWHRSIYITKSMIPFDIETIVIRSFLIDGIPEVSSHRITKIVSIVLRSIFHTKIIYTEIEFCWSFIILPKANSTRYWSIPIRLERVAEMLICQYSYLFQLRHALLDFNVDPLILCYYVINIIFFLDDIWDIFILCIHIFQVLYWYC